MNRHCPICEKENRGEIILQEDRRHTDGAVVFYCIRCGEFFCLDGSGDLIKRKEWMRDAEEYNS